MLPIRTTRQYPSERFTVSDDVRTGAANSIDRTQTGVPLANVVIDDLGILAVGANNTLINAATGAELPNANTITYTFTGIAQAVSPIDGTLSTGLADGPRNLVLVVTHASSIVAMTALVTGKDQYGQTMSELFTITATGTSKTANGLKAFKSITTVALTSASNATANTAGLGFGNVLGLSARVALGGFVQGTFNGVKEATQGTFVDAVATAATTTTGDIRGTYTPNGTLDGAKRVTCFYIAKNGPTDADGFGVTQA